MSVPKLAAAAVAALVAVVSVTNPRTAAAQEGPATSPPTLVVTQWKCDITQVGSILADVDSVARPVWEEMVQEGRLIAAGSFAHEWGDEYNLGFYYTAADKSAFFSAWDEINRRIAERYPEMQNPLVEHCSAHRDNIYTLGPSTEDSGS